MKKVIYRELEYTDVDILYDNDGIKEISGKNNALYIIAGREYCPVNDSEYHNIKNTAENLAYDICDFMEGNNTYFKNYKEILKYYGVKFSPAAVKKFKIWADKFTGELEDIADYLTLTTGEKWNTYTETGYSQGDYATGIYCENHYTDESLALYVGAAAGTITEFCRVEDEETVCGYFVPDEIKWNTEKLRAYLSDIYGDKPEEISIELFDGYTRIATYKTF